MLLLYHHLRYFDNLTCPIYIPLCFYFICCSDRQSSILLYIYIPLCFYFIWEIILTLISIIYLHSTMLLLYLSLQLPLLSLLNIFTFHYASTLSAVADDILKEVLYLHSTMLLLYLTRELKMSIHQKIYIPLCFYFIPVSVTDTSDTLSDLHSTMLLLYRNR